jgi:uncharacterized BrkB/YihY/UPF0761 family membrane protein
MAADNLADGSAAILVIGIVLAIFGGSRLFVTIEEVLCIVHRAPSRLFVQQNLVAIGMLCLFIVLGVVMVGAAGAPAFLINVLPGLAGVQFVVFVGGIVVSTVTGCLLFSLIYFLVPNKPMRLADLWCGSLVASILLDIFIVLFPLYIRRFMGSFIGLLGFAILLILFFYYLSVILILGAQINAYCYEGVPPLPQDLVKFISNVTKPTVNMPPAVRLSRTRIRRASVPYR